MKVRDLKISEIIKGSFLADSRWNRHRFFVLWLALLALISIYSGHMVEKKVLTLATLQSQVKDLNSEFTETRSKLMKLSMRSKVKQRAEMVGLVESSEPPIVIVTDKNGRIVNKTRK